MRGFPTRAGVLWQHLQGQHATAQHIHKGQLVRTHDLICHLLQVGSAVFLLSIFLQEIRLRFLSTQV